MYNSSISIRIAQDNKDKFMYIAEQDNKTMTRK